MGQVLVIKVFKNFKYSVITGFRLIVVVHTDE